MSTESTYKWRKKHPKKYKAIQRKATKKYWETHKEEISRNTLNYYYRHREEILKKLKEKRNQNKEGNIYDIL